MTDASPSIMLCEPNTPGNLREEKIFMLLSSSLNKVCYLPLGYIITVFEK